MYRPDTASLGKGNLAADKRKPPVGGHQASLVSASLG